jgi:phosphoribosyl-AMP cyclohydrolase
VLMAAEHRRRGAVWERGGEHGTVQTLTTLLDECFESAINLATRRHGDGWKPAERGQSFRRGQVLRK